MNTVPRLIENFSWATIASFSTQERIEFAMLAIMSGGLIAAVVYGIYAWIFRRDKS